MSTDLFQLAHFGHVGLYILLVNSEIHAYRSRFEFFLFQDNEEYVQKRIGILVKVVNSSCMSLSLL